ncbi:5,6-dimethylbenzimidazole synthase [Methylovirgula sp. 4M-Z18]|uniref:5,6-dimethylbenzimidazole synthase n=1 Tax=Methylovirgula sp. 4M-Z18 TaxID=2293567 RepID=UPI000E2F9513|nr:5,6-dimethylbenzimidazole synthase [Methylovirgula sp. 4M-Z18]RFB79885.1 5,6-dimethylbenzimidazole synthase [Methylovirgula sp. 4M-Z18]
MTGQSSGESPIFGDDFRTIFSDLIAWRRDVRHFRTDPIPPEVIADCLALADLAPSVGNSQPWRWINVSQPDLRAKVKAAFTEANNAAAKIYDGDQAALYARLKLEGIDAAPVQFAVFCEESCPQGNGLGRQTMPEMLRYSTVCSIHTFWLAARARGIGMGWISIVDPAAITETFGVPSSWTLIGYLCVGYPAEDHIVPELERRHWQHRTPNEERFRKQAFK